jgi:U3 small nucleolar RNA-associated protein 20
MHVCYYLKAQKDSEHKAVKSKYAEDEEILRVPIALAMIKLLQNLPKGALERYLPG